MGSPRPSAAVCTGLATIYVVWGSTYLALDLGIRTIPPLLMMSARHVIAGSIGTRTALASAAIVAAVAVTVAAPVASPAAGEERRRFRGIRERPEPGVPSGEPG